MVDQPEGRPKSPGPGKIKPAKKHNVSKPYERPSTSRGVLARVRELITPVTPAWLKDLVLKPPVVTSVTDHLENTIAEVQEEVKEEKRPTLELVTLPLRSERSNMLSTPKQSPVLSTPTRTKTESRSSSTLEDTLGEIKWSSMRPSVKDKYSFNLSVFNTPNKSLNKSSNKSSRVSFGGCSLQRSLLQKREDHNVTDRKTIKVTATPRSVTRPTVTSSTAKKILQQLEALSKPLGHLPSSRPSTPGSRPSTPLSRSSTPSQYPYRSTTPSFGSQTFKSEKCSLPVKSLSSSTPRQIKTELNGVRYLGGKMRRDKQKHYTRVKDEEEEEMLELPYDTVELPNVQFTPIVIESIPLPIKIVNQPSKIIEDHTPLKEAVKSILNTSSTQHLPLKIRKISEEEDSSDSSRTSYSFTAPLPLTNTLVSSDSNTEFSFDSPSVSIDDVLKSNPPFPIIKTNSPHHGPPGSWSCVPCKLSNPGTMTRCSGCEAPNPSTSQHRSPFGIKRAPITPMKPPVQLVKVTHSSPLTFNMSTTEKESSKPLVTFNLQGLNNQGSWSCCSCLLSNKNEDNMCIACQAPNPKKRADGPASDPLKLTDSKPAVSSPGLFAAGSMAKFAPSGWSCDGCMLNNATAVDKCIACGTAKPGPKPGPGPSVAMATVPGATVPSATVIGAVNLLSKFAPKGWSCTACMLNNEDSSAVCKACGTAKPSSPKPVNPPGPLFAAGSLKPQGWNCGTCLLNNSDDVVKCKACQTLKAGEKEPATSSTAPSSASDFMFGAAPGATTSTTTPGTKSDFDFGTTSVASAASTGFIFGAAPQTKPAEEKTFGFGSSSTSSGFNFGGTAKPEEAKAAAPTFNFGGATKTEETKPSPPTFNFGGAVKTSEVKPVAASFNFGGVAKNTEVTPTAPTFNFGGTQKSEETKPVATTFNFGGAPKVEEAKSAAPTFNFGGIPKSTETKPTGFNFGGATKPENKNTGFNFGGISKPTEPSTGFNFGGATASTPAFNFGGTSQVEIKADVDGMDASSRSPKHFGATDSGGFSFASTDKPSFSTATPAFSFGNQPATSTFGSSAVGTFGSTAFGSTPAPAFGSTPAPAFGSTPAPAFGSTPAPAATSGFNFGGTTSTTSATFGAPATSVPSFNFGGNGTTTPAFGTAPTTGGFNFSAAPPSTFGSSNAPSTFGASSTPVFNFGGSSTETKPTPSFNFGGNNSNNTAGGFNFSATTQQPAQFGTSTPSSFGAPQPAQFGTPTANNMFSPSTSASGRKIKKAVRRTKR